MTASITTAIHEKEISDILEGRNMEGDKLAIRFEFKSAWLVSTVCLQDLSRQLIEETFLSLSYYLRRLIFMVSFVSGCTTNTHLLGVPYLGRREQEGTIISNHLLAEIIAIKHTASRKIKQARKDKKEEKIKQMALSTLYSRR